MTTDEEMRRLAEAVPDGPWIEDPDEPGVVMRPDRPGGWDGEMVAVANGDFYRVNAAFIAAANPQAVLALLDRVAAAEVRAKQADDLDTRNQRLTGDWKDALERAAKAEAEVELYHGRWSDAMKSAEDLRANYEQVRQMNAAQVETIAELRATVARVRALADKLGAHAHDWPNAHQHAAAVRAALAEGGDS